MHLIVWRLKVSIKVDRIQVKRQHNGTRDDERFFFIIIIIQVLLLLCIIITKNKQIYLLDHWKCARVIFDYMNLCAIIQ